MTDSGVKAAPSSRPAPERTAAPATSWQTRGIRLRALVRASGGPRYAVAVGVDAVGTGLLGPFLILFVLNVLRLPSGSSGLAMSAVLHCGVAFPPPLV